MSLEEEYQQRYEIGFPIFEKLFHLKKDDFIRVMKDIFADNESVLRILENSPSVVKTIRDDEPQEITVYFYDGIEINYSGVRYKPEHGSATTILKFDKFFNLNAAL